MSGTLDPAFASWTQLESLAVADTQVSGTLDASFSRWTALNYLFTYRYAMVALPGD